MQIAEGINIQNVDEAGSQAEVLKERGEHVHWVALHYNLAKQSQKEERESTYVEQGTKKVDS